MNTRAEMKNRSGFTMVEMMVAMAIMPLVFLSVATLLNLSQVIFNTNDKFAQINLHGLQTLRYIETEIGQTSPNAAPQHLVVATDANGNSVVRFRIPVDWDNDGDVVGNGSNPPVEWGAYDEAGQFSTGGIARPDILNRWVRYSINDNEQLIRELTSANGAVIDGTARIVANNVQFFTAAQAGNTLTTTLGLSVDDTVGQGGAARTFTSTFTNRTTLRNAVS